LAKWGKTNFKKTTDQIFTFGRITQKNNKLQRKINNFMAVPPTTFSKICETSIKKPLIGG